MPRTIWSGSISFGLVNIPIKVTTAQRSKDISFHQLHEPDGARIRYQKVCPKHGEIPKQEIVRGYPIGQDHHVVISDEELEQAEPEKSRRVDIEDFVPLSQIDPFFFDRPYFLVPDEGASKPYALLLQALHETDKVGIARVVMRGKAYLVAIRPKDGALTMETMRFAEEIVPASAAMEDVELPVEKLDKREKEMAQRLVETLSADFEPDQYENQYRNRILEIVEKKAEGEEVVLAPQVPARKPTGDLLSMLEESVQKAQREIEAES